MITRIYQTPPRAGFPEGSSTFIGLHDGTPPALGDTFDRYALTWTILDISHQAPGLWHFILAARPSESPLITDH